MKEKILEIKSTHQEEIQKLKEQGFEEIGKYQKMYLDLLESIQKEKNAVSTQMKKDTLLESEN